MDADCVAKMLADEARLAGSQRALARSIGVSASFLNDIILGKREPSGKPLQFLGLVRVVSYHRGTK